MKDYPVTTTESLIQTAIEWASFPGDWIISTLAGMDIGAYLGFVEADIEVCFLLLYRWF